MLNQDLFCFVIYTLFIVLGFKLIFLSKKSQPLRHVNKYSPQSAPKKVAEQVSWIKSEIQTTQIEEQEISRKKIQQQKEKTPKKINLIPIQESPCPEDEETKNLRLIQQAIEEESEIQKLNFNNQSKILVSETHSLNKKQKHKLRRQRQINKLKAVKDHYKTIIAELQRKLQNHCQQHNQSLQSLSPYQSIVFQEQDICSSYEQNPGPFQLNVSQINNLKEQLYMHQQILTNLLEQQNQLKDKVRELESQNKKLIETSSKFKETQQPKEQSQILINILSNLENSQHKMERSTAKYQESIMQSSRAGLFESHIIETETNMQRSTLQQSGIQNYMAKSTISMMSILEGVLNVGLLGQCRFLNQINKKFVMQQIKKALKRKVVDTQIAYNSEQIQKGDILRELKQESNILFLIKLSNSKKLAIFVQYPVLLEINSLQRTKQDKNVIVLMDLNKRKSITANQLVNCQQKTLIFGNDQIIITRSMPLTLSSKGTGAIITQANPIQELIDHSDKAISISILEIYTLIFQD